MRYLSHGYGPSRCVYDKLVNCFQWACVACIQGDASCGMSNLSQSFLFSFPLQGTSPWATPASMQGTTPFILCHLLQRNDHFPFCWSAIEIVASHLALLVTGFRQLISREWHSCRTIQSCVTIKITYRYSFTIYIYLFQKSCGDAATEGIG